MKKLVFLGVLSLFAFSCSDDDSSPTDKVEMLKAKEWKFQTVTANGKYVNGPGTTASIPSANLPKASTTAIVPLSKFIMTFEDGGKLYSKPDNNVSYKHDIGTWKRKGKALDSIQISFKDVTPTQGVDFHKAFVKEYLTNFFALGNVYDFKLNSVGSTLSMDMNLQKVAPAEEVAGSKLPTSLKTTYTDKGFKVTEYSVVHSLTRK